MDDPLPGRAAPGNLLRGISAAQISSAVSCARRLTDSGVLEQVARLHASGTFGLAARLTTPVVSEQIRSLIEGHRQRWAELCRVPDLGRLLLPDGIARLAGLVKHEQQISAALGQWGPALRLARDMARTWGSALRVHQAASLKLASLSPSVPEALLAWQTSIGQLSKRLEETRVLALRADLGARLLEPHGVYTRFVERTARRIEQSHSVPEAEALQASIHVAWDHVLAASHALSEVIAPVTDIQPLLPARRPRLFRVQQDELLAAAGSEDGQLGYPPAGEAGLAAAGIVLLVAQCNEAAKLRSGLEVFTPTTRMLQSCAHLYAVVPMTPETFAQFVDALFFMLYEGAGHDSLRFLTQHGGVLVWEECKAIEYVKFLRNKWLRHDPDHGATSKIRRTWRDVAEVLDALGMEHLPTKAEHFRALHCRLLREVADFLTYLLDKLTGTEGGEAGADAKAVVQSRHTA